MASSIVPVQVSGLANIVALDAGHYHSLAVKNDGSVWSWGYNIHGQLGDGTTTQRTTPVQVLSVAGAIGVASGDSHNLALTASGTVWAWGLNNYSQVDPTAGDKTTPVQVSGLSGVNGVAAGAGFSLVLLADGSVLSWGANGSGQLGDGTTTNSPSRKAVQLPVILSVVLSGNGIGSVTSNPAGISCPSGSCSMGVSPGTSVTLAPLADSLSLFTGWSGGACGGTADCTMTVAADTKVTAAFALKEFPLNVTITGSGQGSVNSSPAGIACSSGSSTSCSGSFSSYVNLFPTASAGSLFSGWTGCTSTAGTTCIVFMNGTKNITATFTAAPKVKVGAKGFSTLQAAYDDSATTTGAVIKLLEGTLTGNFTAGRGIAVKLEGGYNAAYDAVTAETTIQGAVKVRAGTVRMKRINVR